MAEKARLFEDWDTRKQILRAPQPKTQKALGRKVQRFKDGLWKKRCLDIVVQGNLHKFRQNGDLKLKLLATGDCLMAEASPVDTIWGYYTIYDI